MSELDDLRKQYRLLAEPSLPSNVKAEVEQMIATHRAVVAGSRDVASDARDAVLGEPSTATRPAPAVPSARLRHGPGWLSRIPLTRRNLTSLAAGFVALVAACSVVISIVTHHPVSTPAPVSPTAGGKPTISSPSLWPADPSYMPLLIGIWTALGVSFLASALTSVYFLWKKHAWILGAVAGFIAVACAIEGVDQWQGGPLGRSTYPYYSSGTNMQGPLPMGQSILVLSGSLIDHTPLSFEILSIHPIGTRAGLRLQAGVLVTRKGTFGGDYSVPEASGSKTYNLLGADVIRVPNDLGQFPVAVLPNTSSRKSYVYPILLATRTGPGPQTVRGFVVVYRWGPFVYRMKLNTTYGIMEFWPHKVPNLQ